METTIEGPGISGFRVLGVGFIVMGQVVRHHLVGML